MTHYPAAVENVKTPSGHGHGHHHDDPTVPRPVLIGIAVMLSMILAFTASVSYGFLPHAADPAQSRAAANVGIAEMRPLRFADRADGAVVVTDAGTGATVHVFGFGEGGFLRATMRRLAKSRRAAGIGPEPAFHLVRWDNGAMSLDDPTTGKSAEIFGFGANQNKLFADMLQRPAA